MFTTLAHRLDALRARYAEPHRAYHTQAHLDAVLAGVTAARARLHHPDAVELAAWYHDAIYDPARNDNEERSAQLLETELSGLADPALVARAALLVRCTADHALPPGTDGRDDAAVFLDLDLAVLGADGPAFDAYEQGIAAEYVPVHGPERFRAGRAQFLAGALARPRLFHTAEAHAALDAAARTNMHRALAALEPRNPDR